MGLVKANALIGANREDLHEVEILGLKGNPVEETLELSRPFGPVKSCPVNSW